MNKAKLVTVAAAFALAFSTGAASAAAGGNGKGNNGNGNGNGNGGNSGGSTTPVLTASCAGADISIAGASCLGFFSGNLNGNKPSLGAINTSLAAWGVNLTDAVASGSMLSGLGDNNATHTINFTQQLYGDTIIGVHYGKVTGANGVTDNNVTAFYRFNAGDTTGIDSFTTSFASLSNATLYATGLAPVAAVPEPGTYAMMLAGLALMGFVARRRKQQ